MDDEKIDFRIQAMEQYKQALEQHRQRVMDGGRIRTPYDFEYLDFTAFGAFTDRYFAIDADERTTTLGFAAMEGNNHMVIFLLRWNHKNEQDQFGYTPLMKAAENGHMPAVETLLDQGANTTFRSLDDGSTAIILAARGGYDGIVVALLNNGADKDDWTNGGITPLMEAARNGHLAVVETLLNVDADVTLTSDNGGSTDGYTALHFATHEGHLGVVNAFLSKGVDKDLPDKYDEIPLVIAVRERRLPIVRFLLAEGADKDSVASAWTPLMTAFEVKSIGAAEALLAAGADPNITDANDNNHTALYNSFYVDDGGEGIDICMIKALVDHGADVNFRAYFNTVLHEACWANADDKVLELLLRAGADERALDNDGKTPAYYCDDGVNGELVREVLARRAWRRRGWLVMLRSRYLARLEAERTSVAGAAGMETRQRRMVRLEAGQHRARMTGDGGSDEGQGVNLAAKLFEATEDVFKTVVSFL